MVVGIDVCQSKAATGDIIVTTTTDGNGIGLCVALFVCLFVRGIMKGGDFWEIQARRNRELITHYCVKR